MKGNINYLELFNKLDSVCGLPFKRRGRYWYSATYLDGVKHSRKDKVTAYMKGGKPWLCEQGNGRVYDLFEYIKEYMGKTDYETGEYLRGQCTSTYIEKPHIEPDPIFVYPHIVERTLGKYTDTLFKYLCTLYSEDRVKWAYRELNIGSRGDATVYWYRDKDGKFLHDKQITYKMDGHRNKDIHPTRKMKSSYGFTGRCYFGEHLPHNEAFVVEAEKTVLVAKIAYPNRTFLATGGSNNLKRNPNHLLLPDLDQIELWKERGNILPWWEYYNKEDLQPKSDLADLILTNREKSLSLR